MGSKFTLVLEKQHSASETESSIEKRKLIIGLTICILARISIIVQNTEAVNRDESSSEHSSPTEGNKFL